MDIPKTPEAVTLETVFQRMESLGNDIQQIKSLITSPTTLANDMLTPSEVCESLKISRNKFESMRRDGLVKVYQPYGKGKKSYVRRSEIATTFPLFAA